MFFSSEGILAQNKILCTWRNLGQSRVHKTYSFLKVSLSRRSIKCFQVSVGSKSSTHYLSDTNRFDVSRKGPSSKRRICLYRLGSEWNFCCLLMLSSATYTGPRIELCFQVCPPSGNKGKQQHFYNIFF